MKKLLLIFSVITIKCFSQFAYKDTCVYDNGTPIICTKYVEISYILDLNGRRLEKMPTNQLFLMVLTDGRIKKGIYFEI